MGSKSYKFNGVGLFVNPYQKEIAFYMTFHAAFSFTRIEILKEFINTIINLIGVLT